MTGHFKQFVGHSLRPVLIRLLRWTEQSGPLPSSRASLFFHREVRVPAWGVAGMVWVLLSIVLYSEVGPGWRPLAAVAILTTALLSLFRLYLRHDHPELAHDEDAVALLGLLMVASALGMGLWFDVSRNHAWVSPYGLPLASVSILTAVLLHPRVGVVVTLVLSLLFGVLSAFSLEGALVVCFGGMAGVARSLRVRTRTDLIWAGFWVFLGEAAAVGVLAFLERWPAAQVLPALKWVFGGSLFSALLVLLLLPFLEHSFSRLSNIRLLEISDVNHPLLKELSLEAPGTFHHSLVTASLAQAAADRIGANGLLCRVGAYFHDVGKLAKPEYFVENQGALGNPHELLPANLSRIVIQSHVKDGLALARRHNLDRALMDFIAVHHGTSRVEYFYRRAIEQTGGAEPVDEDLFRYPGPKPHTRETAIVMLADSVEASTRTLENPTPQRIADHVHRIVDAKIVDGQCDRVPLTLLEVQEVKASFASTLTGVYHTPCPLPDERGDGPGISLRPDLMNFLCRTWGVRRPSAEARAVWAARRALRAGGPLPRGDVHLVWTTRARLREMNRRFRRADRYTDVISFLYAPDPGAPAGFIGPFGDLYIAVDQARRNARRFGVSLSEEIVRLSVHGALHLLGYTDYTPDARARMWAVQEPIVRAAMDRSIAAARA